MPTTLISASVTTPITIFKPLNPLHGAQTRTRLPKLSPNSLQIIAQSPPSVNAEPSSATAGTSSTGLKLNKYSSRVTEPKSPGGSQAVLHGVGLSEEDMSKPQIGISSVWFNTVGVSDAISMGTRGTIIAMGRLNRPSIMIYGGTIKPGHFRGKSGNTYDIVSAFQVYGEYVGGSIIDERRKNAVVNSCPGSGACGGMYTANTMACTIETMGMSLPYSSSIPAGDPLKLDECRLAGKYMLELLKLDLKPGDIITPMSLRNAMVIVMALGGSTNAVLHLIAIARSVGLELTLDDFQRASNGVPFLADLKPSGKYVMEDIHKIGGTPAVIRYLLELGFVDGDCITGTQIWAHDNFSINCKFVTDG
ncbi:dihydroxy-acid dehydratase chloroplastic [Tripterygium wilfordii]|uniref:Dihydroxy-acid dehydratase chloroplastic n=1 Tax=Tripterygium wilfordii TaxID=458696 RepID=A0A7J7CWR5_TRIWF|nr:dihydroxy-acid dehydratase chloroplastic [Tripterygium wilfordii]